MTDFGRKAFIKSFCKMGSGDCQRRQVQMRKSKSGMTFKIERVFIKFSFFAPSPQTVTCTSQQALNLDPCKDSCTSSERKNLAVLKYMHFKFLSA